MKAFLKLFLPAIAVAVMFSATSFAVPDRPSVSGPWSLGTWTTQSMPSPTLRMAAQPYSYPTNRWWGSTYIDNTNGANPYSYKMSLGAMMITFDVEMGQWYDYQSPSNKKGAGYILGSPVRLTVNSDNIDVANTANLNLYVYATSNTSTAYNQNEVISSSATIIQNYSDWAATAIVQDRIDSSKRMTVTFGKGFMFTYNTFSSNVKPMLKANGGGVYITAQDSTNGKALIRAGNEWYGVYATSGTSFATSSYDNNSGGYWEILINFPSWATAEQNRYMSIALLQVGGTEANAKPIFDEYYKYAYNFITDTKVNITQNNSDSSISTRFDFTFNAKRTGGTLVSGQTVFALYPHQWGNFVTGSAAPYNPTGGFTASGSFFPTLRGKMKIYEGSSFTTKYKFNGMLPYLTYEISDTTRQTKLQNYIDGEEGYNINTAVANNTYRKGKALAKAANMIPVAHQAGDFTARNKMISQVKTELELWYKGQSGRSFTYDSVWGGIIGTPYDFGADYYNDHHFHYGYFVYASAILAMFDPDFASSAQYKDIVDLLVREYANPDKNNLSFPFLRNFDVYEGHSWANGRGGIDNAGIDQESISEAMNAWSAIYLWGIATNNADWIKLGMYGYVTESAASKEYYFDEDDQTYPSNYTHRGGILYDSAIKYITHWNVNASPQEKYGIWILPLTPSMLYLGYNPVAAGKYYDKMSRESQSPGMWRDIWIRYRALFDGAGALSEWENNWKPSVGASEEGSSLSYSYQFINFFAQLGAVSTGYYAKDAGGNVVPFTVMSKSNETTFITYNNSDNYKEVSFYSDGGALQGSVSVPPYTTVSAKNNFQTLKYDSLRTIAYGNGWHTVVLNKYTDTAVTLTAITAPTTIDASKFYVLPAAFTVSASTAVAYVQFKGNIPSTFLASQIQVYQVNADGKNLSLNSAAQQITVLSENNGKVNVRIQTSFPQAGNYVLAIPRVVSTASGTIKTTANENVSVNMAIYSDVATSTKTQSYTGGAYSTTTIQGAVYTLAPSTTGFVFRPEMWIFTASSVTADQNFTAYKSAVISGAIKNNINNSNLAATLQIYNSVDKTTASAVYNGAYQNNIIIGADYVIIPQLEGFIFEPESKSFNAQVALAQDFKGYAISKTSVSISGVVSAAPVAVYDVVLNSTITKQITGNGVIDNLKEGKAYIVTPVDDKYIFEPAFSAFTASSSITPKFNFVSYAATYATGTARVTNNGASTMTISGVLNVYDSVAKTTSTKIFGANGIYKSDKLYVGRNYEMWVSSPGYFVYPECVSFTAGSEIYKQDFYVFKITFNMSGTILTEQGVPVNTGVMTQRNIDFMGVVFQTPIIAGRYSVDSWTTSMSIRPYSEQYVFVDQWYTPPYPLVSTSIVQNFTAYPGSHFIGKINYVSSTMLPKINMLVWDSVDKSTKTLDFTSNTPTDEDGDGIKNDFDIDFRAGRTYSITPKDPDGVYTYEPANITFASGQQYVRQDFTAYKGANIVINFTANGYTASDVVAYMNSIGDNIMLYDAYTKTASKAKRAGVINTVNSNVASIKNLYVPSEREYVVIMPSNGKVTGYSFVGGGNQAFYLKEGSTVTVDFQAYPDSQVYILSGTVKATDGANSSITNAVIRNTTNGTLAFSLLDINSAYTVAANSGRYYLYLLKNNQYTIDFGSPDNIYNPKGVSVVKASADQVVNVTASKATNVTGAIKNTIDNSNVDATVYIYDTVLKSSVTTYMANGRYSCMVIQGRSYILTPVKSGFIFDPSSYQFTPNTYAVVKDFAASRITQVIGTVLNSLAQPAPAKIYVYDVVNNSTQTINSSNGSYSFNVVEGNDYLVSVVPTTGSFVKPMDLGGGTSFIPNSVIIPDAFSVTGTTVSQTQNMVTYPAVTLKGTIKNNKDGSPVNVNMYFYDVVDKSTSAKSSSNGSYSKDLAEGRTYIVIPSTTNFIFEPPNVSLTMQTSTTTDFTAFAVGQISATVKDKRTNKDIAAIMSVYDHYLATATAKAFNGTYNQKVIEGRVYTLTPSAANYLFEPASMTITGTNAVLLQSFVAVSEYTLSGKLSKDGSPLSNMDVIIYSGNGSTITVRTDAQGLYSSAILYGESYLVAPSTKDYKWTPESLEFVYVLGNIDNADFAASNKFNKVTPYPNPFRASKGSTHILLSNIKAGDVIRIFSLSGDKVYEATAQGDGDYLWDVKNNAGKNIASGIYMFHIESKGKVSTGKIVIER